MKGTKTAKVADRGAPCMFVGYSEGHTPDTYDMLYVKTGAVYQSRDVTWLNRMYFPKKTVTGENIVVTPNVEDLPSDGTIRGAIIEPNETWNGDPEFLFKIRGKADSDYAKDLDSRKSASGWITYLCGTIITCKSKLMPIVALSVTEAELFAAVMCVQDMMFIMRVLESLGLKVEKPMILEIDNKGVIDLVNNWSVGGRTRHIDAKNWFLRDLKEEGIIQVEYINTEKNTSDINTKNLGGPAFESHVINIIGWLLYSSVQLAIEIRRDETLLMVLLREGVEW